MMKLTVKTDAGDTAIAHIKDDDGRYIGTLYSVTECFPLHGDNSSFLYDSKTDSSKDYESPNDDCKIYFRFAFCWRGVWEGRIYFPNYEEFWSEEIKVMADLWAILEDEMKKMIMAAHPGYYK